MSVETAIRLEDADDPVASTSLLSNSSVNHNVNSTYRSRSNKNEENKNDPHKVHFDVINENKKSTTVNPNFVRDSAVRRPPETLTSGGLASRLSLAIRRSLRLGPKQRTTVPRPIANREDARGFRFSDDKNAFTSYTDLRKESCLAPYGTIGELQYMIQMNRRSQVG
ncbi:Rab-GAP TBC domain-containing protein [Aphelenchoides besseyi]|nr:Rab-GAP TBC domain-containing protein [Aphelenchoides besseyi]